MGVVPDGLGLVVASVREKGLEVARPHDDMGVGQDVTIGGDNSPRAGADSLSLRPPPRSLRRPGLSLFMLTTAGRTFSTTPTTAWE